MRVRLTKDSGARERWWLSSELSKEVFPDLVVYQPQKGYRFSIDAFLLADFVRLKPRERALELGAGCGIVSLFLAKRFPETLFVALEIQERLLRCLALNIYQNRLQKRVLAVRGDLRTPPFRAGTFDVVFTNPPFYPVGRGRLSPLEEERLARHEILATLPEITKTASLLLKNRGRFVIIYPASRLVELFAHLEKVRLQPKVLQVIYSYPGDEGRLVRVEAVKGAGKELKIRPPFFIYQHPGGPYTPEAEGLFAP